jgi:predicted kinase
MNKEQALQVIKQALDQATAKGVFSTITDATIVAQALQTIAQELNK